MKDLLKDTLYAGRLLARNPGFAATAVLLVALGAGANFAIYSVLHAVLLNPLPFERQDRLAAISETSAEEPDRQLPVSVPDFFDWQQQSRSFAALAGYHTWFYNLTGGGEPERITGGVMTSNLPSMLGVRPVAGRTFTAEEQGPGGKPLALLGEDLWRRRFGGDPGVVGRTVLLDDVPFTVVGVLPSSFDLPRGAEIWKPLAHGPGTVPRNFQFLNVVGRLAPGMTVGAARAEIRTVAARLERQYPDSNKGRGALLQPLSERLTGEVRPALLVLFGAVLLMLVLTCVNVANLLLVRAERRRGELAVRLALGVSRARLVRQFAIEGLLLALLGCAAGLGLAVWGSRLLVAFSPKEVPRLESAHIGLPVLGLALVVASAAGLLFSVLPALWASRQNPGAALRAASSGGGRRPLVSLLVIGEIAVALVLLVGAGLMIESFARLRSIDPGFAPAGLLTMRISLPEAKYPEGAHTALFFQRLEEELRRLPGVASASFAFSPPMCPGPKSDNAFTIEGRPEDSSAESASRTAFIRPVSPAYFQTLRIPLLQGRVFSGHDSDQTAAVAIINRSLARRFFPGESAVGKQLTIGARLGTMGTLDSVPREIVGVVGDVRPVGLAEEPVPEIYFPLAQGTWRSMAVLVRTDGDPAALTKPVMRAVWALDSDLPLADVATLEENVAKSIAQPRFYMALLAIFAAVAWVLAMVGVYGVVTQAASRRNREIGLRLALGAGRRQILQRVLADGLILALAGVACGTVAALWLSRALESLLFGASARDPGAFLSVAALVSVAALIAGCIPAYRATRVDPRVVLRSE